MEVKKSSKKTLTRSERKKILAKKVCGISDTSWKKNTNLLGYPLPKWMN